MKSSKRNLTGGGVLRRIAAAFLAGVFALGIAAASPIDAKAAESHEINFTTIGMTPGSTDEDWGLSSTDGACELNVFESPDSVGFSGPLEAGKTYYILCYADVPTEWTDDSFTVTANGKFLTQKTIEEAFDAEAASWQNGYFYIDDDEYGNMPGTQVVAKFTYSVPDVSSNVSKASTVSTPHTHHMEWEVVTEPTEDADGVIAYRCSECGYTEYQQPLASFGVYNFNLAKQIRNAAANGTITVNAAKRGWISYAPEVFRALKDRPDVTLVTDYRYKGVLYEMTIPAGADLTALGDLDSLNPGDCFGYRFLAQYFTTIEQ